MQLWMMKTMLRFFPTGLGALVFYLGVVHALFTSRHVGRVCRGHGISVDVSAVEQGAIFPWEGLLHSPFRQK